MAINKNALKEIKAKAKKIEVTHNSRFGGSVSPTGKKALITLTYHKNGKRLEMSREIYSALGNPVSVEVDCTDEYLIFRDGSGAGYKISDRGKRYIIYCADLVAAIVENFKIDLSEHSTHSYYEGEMCEDVFLVQLVMGEEAELGDEEAEEEEELEDEEAEEEEELEEVEEDTEATEEDELDLDEIFEEE